MMTAAHIQPFHPVQIFPEFLFKCLKSRYKIICILFAQRVEMKSFHTLQQIFPELFFCHTKSGSIATRIIDLMPFLRGALRIDADADTDCFFIFSHLCTLYFSYCAKELKMIWSQICTSSFISFSLYAGAKT